MNTLKRTLQFSNNNYQVRFQKIGIKIIVERKRLKKKERKAFAKINPVNEVIPIN